MLDTNGRFMRSLCALNTKSAGALACGCLETSTRPQNKETITGAALIADAFVAVAFVEHETNNKIDHPGRTENVFKCLCDEKDCEQMESVERMCI